MLGIASLSFIAYAGPGNPSKLSTQIEKTVAIGLPQANWGIILEDAETGKVLYQYNAEHVFTPASSTKLLTTVAAISYLGSDYHYVTSININSAERHHNEVNGNVYLISRGDPSFRSKDLQSLFEQLAAANIHTINGNIVIDNSAVQKPYYALGVSIDDSPYCYGDPAIANIIDQNCVPVQLINEENGKSISSKLFTKTRHINVVNHLQWSDANKPETCVFHPILHADNTIELAGCFPKVNKQFDITVPNPMLLQSLQIQDLLVSQHITLNGKILIGKTPESANFVLAQHHSADLTDLVTTTLKHSNNLYANALTKTLGYTYFKLGNNKAGVSAIKAILSPLTHIDFSNYNLEDGAGGSRYNLLSPSLFAKLLYSVYHSPDLSKVIIPALPIGGKDGSLGGRFRDTALQGKVFAKTGTMNNASSLSGYMLDQNNRMLIFSIMINGVIGSTRQAKQTEDTILQIIYSNKLSSS